MTGLLGKIIPGPVGWGLQLLGAGKSLVGKAFAWVTKSTAHILIVALVAVAVWGWLGHRSAAKWHRVADSTEIARKADRREYQAAQKEAEAAQIAANLATEARYSAIAKETNHDYQIALGDAQRRASDYISRMRIKTLDRSPRAAFTAATDNGPGVPSDPAANSELVAVKPDDINACTVDHEYALGAYKWGQSLVKDGLALPEVGF